ncbi:MAG: murein biosynthesis integral membrane protein MurJ [Gammaproteobacteria bacterium]|nr:murein biosynthesis integral membrane protein MurJ [Gammaproteobacteria bacterium]
MPNSSPASPTDPVNASRQKSSLGRASASVGGATMVSRVLGFIRDIIFARVMGAGAVMDVFVLVFQIPNFFRRLFAEGAFSQAFVPVLSEYRQQQSASDTKQLVNTVVGTLGVILLAVTLIGVLASPAFIWLFGSGFVKGDADGIDRFALAVDALRVTFPYLLFISLTACAAGVLNSYGRFFAPAIAPVILNLCLITAAWFFVQPADDPIMILAWAVFLAGILQWLFQWPFLHAIGMLGWPRWGWRSPGVQRIIKLMLPVMFAASATQINLLIDRHIASYLNTGSISWLYYSDRMLEFPLGIFTIAIATVLLPSLSRHHADKDADAFRHTLQWGLRMVLFVVVPAAVGMLFLAEPIMSTLFQHGAFTAHDAHMAGLSLRAYAFGLVGLSLVKILAPAYFARQDMKTPVRASLAAVAGNIVLNIVLVSAMVVMGFYAPHLGLALALSLAAFINAGVLWRGLALNRMLRMNAAAYRILLHALLANIAMSMILVFWLRTIGDWTQLDLSVRAIHLLTVIVSAVMVYFAMLWLLGERWWLRWRKQPLQK